MCGISRTCVSTNILQSASYHIFVSPLHPPHHRLYAAGPFDTTFFDENYDENEEFGKPIDTKGLTDAEILAKMPVDWDLEFDSTRAPNVREYRIFLLFVRDDVVGCITVVYCLGVSGWRCGSARCEP